MGTHGVDSFPDFPPAQRGLLIHKTVCEDAHHVRVCLSGEIDLSTSETVEVVITDALHSHSPRQVSVDLTQVRFIDASGIRALLCCRERAIEAGCGFALTNAQPIIYRVLEITGVLEALAVTPVAARSVPEPAVPQRRRRKPQRLAAIVEGSPCGRLPDQDSSPKRV